MSSLYANIVGYGAMPALVLLLLAAAAGVYFYLPIVGRPLALVLVAAAVAVGAWDMGYNTRASIDKSAQLRSDNAALQASNNELVRQAQEATLIAESSRAAEISAENLANTLQQKVDSYDSQLVSNPACVLSDADARSLSGIAGHGTASPQPAPRPSDVRPASPPARAH